MRKSIIILAIVTLVLGFAIYREYHRPNPEIIVLPTWPNDWQWCPNTPEIDLKVRHGELIPWRIGDIHAVK